MAVTLTAGAQHYRGGSYQSKEDMTVATATTAQALSLAVEIHVLTGPTATIPNYFTLADGVEGQEKLITYSATGTGGTTATGGDCQVVPSNLRPEGSITFRKANDFWAGKFLNGAWTTIARTTYEEGRTTSSGVIPLTVDNYRMVRATGTDQVFTLANGYYGQEIHLWALSGTGVRTVTPASFGDYTSIVMGSAGLNTLSNFALLKFVGGEWQLTSPWQRQTTATAYNAAGFLVT